MIAPRWPDTIEVYRCQHDGAEVQGRCTIGGRPWLNEPSRPDPDCDCPLSARYHREDAANRRSVELPPDQGITCDRPCGRFAP